MKLLTVFWMFAGAACVFGAPVSFGEVESRHENKERHGNIQYIGDERSTIGTRDVSVNVNGDARTPVAGASVVENVVYRERPVPAPYPVETAVEGIVTVQRAD